MATFTINGEPHTVDDDDTIPLLWYLRDVAELRGTKFGCGVAQCGACTVHVDGVATRSLRHASVVTGRPSGDDNRRP